MKIIYSSLHYTNLNPSLGESFEYMDFYKSLVKIKGAEIIFIPFDGILEKGRKRWNQELLETIQREKPDLFFAFMFTDELDPKILEEIKKETTSIAWFSDDHWRFDNYSKNYAPHFSWVVTTYSQAVKKYERMGIRNVIRSQWASDPEIYKPVKWTGKDAPPEVSFVGLWSGPRARMIKELKKAGIPVVVYGRGWEGGKISQEKMLEIFSNSKINLALNPAPGYFNANSLGRLFFRRSMNKIIPDFHLVNNFRSLISRKIPQIKARHFEIPACGGFLMTSMANDLENYYIPGKEMVIYENTDDLIEKIRYYLTRDAEREAIRESGQKRTTEEHTYNKRFGEIFGFLEKNIG